MESVALTRWGGWLVVGGFPKRSLQRSGVFCKSVLHLAGSRAKSINIFWAGGTSQSLRICSYSPQTNEAPEHASEGHGGHVSHERGLPWNCFTWLYFPRAIKVSMFVFNFFFFFVCCREEPWWSLMLLRLMWDCRKGNKLFLRCCVCTYMFICVFLPLSMSLSCVFLCICLTIYQSGAFLCVTRIAIW